MLEFQNYQLDKKDDEIISECFGNNFPIVGKINKKFKKKIFSKKEELSTDNFDFINDIYGSRFKQFDKYDNFVQIIDKDLVIDNNLRKKNLDIVFIVFSNFLMKLHKIDVQSILKENIENNPDFSYLKNRLNRLYADKDSMIEHQEMMLKAGGDGYKNMFSNELDQLDEELFELTVLNEKFINSIDNVIHNMFFNKHESSVKDLTVLNGIKTFVLRRPFNIDLVELQNFFKLEHRMFANFAIRI